MTASSAWAGCSRRPMPRGTSERSGHMRTLIAGSGFVGRAVAAHLARTGEDPVLASRRPPDGPTAAPWTALDVTDPASWARVVRETGPDAVVRVRGPSG